MRGRADKVGLVGLVAALVCTAVLTSPSAQAHTSSTYYKEKWKTPLTVPWRFTTGFPEGDYRNRVIDAHSAWNALGQPMQWSRNTTDYANYSDTTCPTERKNGVHWKDIGFAYAYTCWITGDRLWSTQVTFDSSGSPWWTLTATVPTTHYDLWSAGTQEVGHGTGFLYGGPTANPGHWPESDGTLCADPGTANYNNRESMCESTFSGTRIMRNPFTHDTHTFDGAY